MRTHSFRYKSWLVVLTLLVAMALLLSDCGAEAPQMHRVGVLSGLDYVASITDGFMAEMAELGYVEGENIVYDVQKTNFDMAVYQNILQKFVADKVDLIFVFPTEASLEPGGNITGVRYPGPDIALRRFEIMRELAPEAKRMWIPYQRGYPIVAPQLQILYPAAEAAGITLIEAPADNAADLKADLQARAQSADPGLDAILFLAEPLAVTPDAFAVMGEFATEHRIPIGGALMEAEGYGSIFGVNVDIISAGKQAAPLANKILKGTPAGTIPVVSAENFLQINYRVAQQLGIEVPEGLLAQADEVIR
jgi:putative ABC transport system substrate-binding protein